MIHLFDQHAGHHIRPKTSRRAMRLARREAALSPAASPAGERGHDLLSDAELAVIAPRALQPFAYPPSGEAEATGLWPSAGRRIETALLAGPEGGAA